MNRKMNLFSKICLFAVLLLLSALISCVPGRQYEEVKAANDKCSAELSELKARYESFTAKEKELNTRLTELNRQVQMLQNDTLSLGTSFRRLTTAYEKLTATYDQLLDNNNKLMKGKEEDTKKLMGQYQLTQEELQRKEDKLRIAEGDLEKRKAEIDLLASEMKAAEEALKVKEQRVNELEQILASKDSAMNALRSKVSEALLGFQGNGLTVSTKNGNVYVSLEERLLFESGSTVVDAKGIDALKNLAKVLEKESDIAVMIEGHTDNVPIKSASIKDNWDLSVLRATSILRIITSNSKVDPKRLTAAGRGEFMPIDKANTPEARKKNRRTEIILTPNLDELMRWMNAPEGR
jgi:chemotaxis protein MotB